MANEITISGTLSYSKNSARASLSGSLRADQTGSHYVQAIQDVGTVEEAVDTGDIGTVGWLALRNTDTVHFVEFGATTGVYSIKLLAGGYCQMPWNGADIFARADTAPVKVEYLALEL